MEEGKQATVWNAGDPHTSDEHPFFHTDAEVFEKRGGRVRPVHPRQRDHIPFDPSDR